MDGKVITNICKRTFGTDKPTASQLKYIATMIHPSSYILKHHNIGGKPVTFNISDRDPNRKLAHRPWQVG